MSITHIINKNLHLKETEQKRYTHLIVEYPKLCHLQAELDNNWFFIIDYYKGKIVSCNSYRSLSEDGETFENTLADKILKKIFLTEPLHKSIKFFINKKRNEWKHPTLLHIQDIRTRGVDLFFAAELTPIMSDKEGMPVLTLLKISPSYINAEKDYLYDLGKHDIYIFKNNTFVKSMYKTPDTIDNEIMLSIYSGVKIETIGKELNKNIDQCKYRLRRIRKDFGSLHESYYILHSLHLLGISKFSKKDNDKN